MRNAGSELLTYPPQILGNFTYLRTWVRTKTCPLFQTERMLTAVGALAAVGFYAFIRGIEG
jgi:hypothetical protein